MQPLVGVGCVLEGPGVDEAIKVALSVAVFSAAPVRLLAVGGRPTGRELIGGHWRIDKGQIDEWGGYGWETDEGRIDGRRLYGHGPGGIWTL